jgi:hypothetical protein
MRVRRVVPRDAIPSVDDPVFGADHAGDPGDELIVVDAAPPRAYPVRFLHYHEIVNDRLDRVPIRRLFAFAWQDDHGPDAFYEAD